MSGTLHGQPVVVTGAGRRSGWAGEEACRRETSNASAARHHGTQRCRLAEHGRDAGYDGQTGRELWSSWGRCLVEPVTDPSAAIDGLVTDVEALNLQQGIENGLDAKLSNAQSALDDENQGNDTAAVSKLEAFVNEVEAQQGNAIPVTDGDDLIATARCIIDALQS